MIDHLDDRSCATPELCGPRGHHSRLCVEEKYRPICDRLAEEFGDDLVRVGFVSDYGWARRVSVGDRERGVFPLWLQKSFDDGEFDLTERPDVLENFIERVRAKYRGFGQVTQRAAT